MSGRYWVVRMGKKRGNGLYACGFGGWHGEQRTALKFATRDTAKRALCMIEAVSRAGYKGRVVRVRRKSDQDHRIAQIIRKVQEGLAARARTCRRCLKENLTDNLRLQYEQEAAGLMSVITILESYIPRQPTAPCQATPVGSPKPAPREKEADCG